MAIEKKLLSGSSGTTSGSPESLYAQGIIKTKPYPGGLSYVMRMKLAAEGRGHGDGKTKRQRRQERRDKMIAAKVE